MDCICKHWYHFNIYYIHQYYLIVCNYKGRSPPRALCGLENVAVQVEEDGVNIEYQVDDPMEEYDHVNSKVEDDGTNTLIQDTFIARMDDDHNDLDDAHDLPLLEKAIRPLYEGSKISPLFAILLLVNLKVLNGLLNTCVTQI